MTTDDSTAVMQVTVASDKQTSAVAATTIAIAVAAPVQDDPEDLVDVVIASALEGINLALSMDNPLGFLAMSPISRELEIQGDSPQVSIAASLISQGELHSSHDTPTASPLGNVSSYMKILFGSKKTSHSDPTVFQDSFHRLEDQLSEVK